MTAVTVARASGVTVSGGLVWISFRQRQRLGIYCGEDDDEGSRDELEDDVAHYFPQLPSYVGDAAKNGHGLLIWMS